MNKIILAFTFAFWASFAQAASIPNGGFEDGNLSGFSDNNGMPFATTGLLAPNGSPFIYQAISPIEGDYFAAIPAGNYTTSLTTVPFSVSASDVFSFQWQILGIDYPPFNDSVGVYLSYLDETGPFLTEVLSNINTVGAYSSSGWSLMSYILPKSGLMTATFYSTNWGDTLNDTILALDDVRVTHVPEPAILALMGIGFLGIGASQRRQRNLVAAA